MRTYAVTGINASGEGPASSIAVTWQQPPTAPPTCTLTANTSTPYVNGSVTLTANCTQSPQSWQWSVPGCLGSSPTCQTTSTVAGPASYTVAATNGFGAGTTSQPVSVTWTTPPPGGADYCASYGDVVEVALPWGGTVDTKDIGGMRPGTIIVGRFTVPANASVAGAGQVRFVEYVDGQAMRQMTVSSSKCDFRGFVPGVASPVDPTSTNFPMAWSNDINPFVVYGASTAAQASARADVLLQSAQRQLGHRHGLVLDGDLQRALPGRDAAVASRRDGRRRAPDRVRQPAGGAVSTNDARLPSFSAWRARFG